MTQRRLLPLLLLSVCMGCLAERSHERDPRLSSEITRQERWAQDAIAGRATAEDLERIRAGDPGTVDLGRKQLRKLTSSVDRGTWIRDAAVESLRDDGDDPGLVADFEKAGQTRNEALQAADELAQALAETRGGVTLPDLRKALESLKRARDGEAKLARELGAAAQAPVRAPDAGTTATHAPDAGTTAAKAPAAGTAPAKAPAAATGPAARAAVSPLARLSTVALPMPRPFIAATARYLYAHPEEKLSGFAADDATEIRAQLAELEAHPPAARPSRPAEARAETAAASAPDAGQPAAPSNAQSVTAAAAAAAASSEPSREGVTFTVGKDAQKLIARRGPPRSFATRPDGLFSLHYQETRGCGAESCLSDVEYLFDATGRLVREEATPKR